jgi:acyl-CoA reductase-like NAD-dependent aldehyde dehydrogenase
VLSWGLPLAEVVCSVLPSLLAGRTAVVKPSLRAPLSTVVVAHLATQLGLPPGVLNVVQGTGPDVGAALLGTAGLATLHVRASDRTIMTAARAAAGTGVPLHPLRAGGNLAVAGPDSEPEAVAAAAVEALRLHSAGGPLSLPLLTVHGSVADEVTAAVLTRLPECRPAPLPAESLRHRALAYLAKLSTGGARILSGGTVPDDAAHRMGWLMPPVVAVADGPPVDSAGEPTGPVLTISVWRRPEEIAARLTLARYSDGIACLWGDPTGLAELLPQRSVVVGVGPAAALTSDAGPLPRWCAAQA